MHKIMAELHQDHIHLSRLLHMLIRHVKVLQEDGDPDFHMMIDIVDYIRNYSDLFHHPKEDNVYKVFKARSKIGIEIVDALLEEHKQIPKVTVEFQQLLEGALDGSIIVSRDDLSEKIIHFIKIQREHLNLEEEKLFPLINKTLNKSDWLEVEGLVKQKSDPLFGEQVEERYESLYNSIE